MTGRQIYCGPGEYLWEVIEIKSRALRLIVKVLLSAVILFSIYYIYSVYRVRDLSDASRKLDAKVNDILLLHGLEDRNILEQYQTLKSRRGLEWIRFTKKIELSRRKYSVIADDIRETASGFTVREEDKNVKTAALTISEAGAVLSKLKFRFTPEKGLLAIIIDDLGYSRDISHFTRLGIPLTYAVLPGLSFSEYLAGELEEKSLPHILHMPMEPEDSSLIAERHMLLEGMGKEEIRDTLKAALETVPGAAGLNNHMGSKFTADESSAEQLARVLKEEGLYFIDSWTSGSSKAYFAAQEAGVPSARNNFFIDNRNDYEYIAGRLKELTRLAAGREYTIAIGHIQNKNTASALKDFIPGMKEAGITFVEAEKLLR